MEFALLFDSSIACVSRHAAACQPSSKERTGDGADVLLAVSSLFVLGQSEDDGGALNDTNKDMYVIHAMVYQVGILTNSTDNLDLENKTQTGAQESLTFYHTNGSSIDLSKIPEPLLTNVTGENFVGVAPMTDGSSAEGKTWTVDRHVLSDSPIRKERETIKHRALNEDSIYQLFWNTKVRRDTQLESAEKLVKITSGKAIVPEEAGIQSVGLPAFLNLNNNFSQIPVPIPNTSVVHYAKINTLVMPANSTETSMSQLMV